MAMSAVQLVMFSNFDLDTFLPIARQAMGRGVAAKADAAGALEEQHNMLCVAGLLDGDEVDVEHLYSLAYLIAADSYDMQGILQVASLPHVVTQSAARGIDVALVSGTLALWCRAVIRGCQRPVESGVRKVFNKIHQDLHNRNLWGIVKYGSKRYLDDTTYLLENK